MISATAIRRALLKIEEAKPQFRDEINSAVPTDDLVCIYLGLNGLWRENGMSEQLVDGERCEDGLCLDRLRKKQAHVDGDKRRQRSNLFEYYAADR